MFIVAGGEITKAARNWIGNALDASKLSQSMFIDRDDSSTSLPPAPTDGSGSADNRSVGDHR